MSAALADGVLAIVKAATEPLIDEIKTLRTEMAALKNASPSAALKGDELDVVADAIKRIAALEKALGLRS
jgi:hypothetical protein